MEYDEYLRDEYEHLNELFAVLRKLHLVDVAMIVQTTDDERIEKGCKCGRCYDDDVHYLEVYIVTKDEEYYDERDDEEQEDE